jgi:hypothetical protein
LQIYSWHESESESKDAEVFAAVKNGGFAVEIPIDGWGPGTIHTAATFSLELDQPEGVLAAVGPNAERLTGEGVTTNEFGTRYLTSQVDVTR